MINTTNDLFTALSVPKRRLIVELLSERGQMSSTEISDEFKITSAAISQLLKVLREAEVVKMEKRAQQRLYDLNPQALEGLEEWARTMKQTWNARFEQLDQLLITKK